MVGAGLVLALFAAAQSVQIASLWWCVSPSVAQSVQIASSVVSFATWTGCATGVPPSGRGLDLPLQIQQRLLADGEQALLRAVEFDDQHNDGREPQCEQQHSQQIALAIIAALHAGQQK